MDRGVLMRIVHVPDDSSATNTEWE
jgi:hypothetical protein